SKANPQHACAKEGDVETNGQETSVRRHDPGPGILEQLDTGGPHPPRVGRFWFYFADERWEWSPEVAAMHGYPAAAMTPTTAVVLAHKHPDDYQQVAATLETVRRDHRAFSTRHRIVDTHAQVHHVVVVAEQLVDD